MLIKAVKANQHEFSILQYDGDKYIVQRNEILAIMESWPISSRESSQKVARKGRLSALGFMLTPSLPSPERPVDLGIASSTNFWRRRPTTDAISSTTSTEGLKGASLLRRLLPSVVRPPPKAPPQQRGRSSDERAEVASTQQDQISYCSPSSHGDAHHFEWSRLPRGWATEQQSRILYRSPS